VKLSSVKSRKVKLRKVQRLFRKGDQLTAF